MWETMKLQKVCKIISGNSIPAKKKEEHFTGAEGMPYVATKDVGLDGSINYKNGVYIPDEYRKKFKISPAGATLVCAEGGSAGRKIAFSNEDCCFVNKLFSLQPDKNITPKFIYYYTLSSGFQSQFKEAMHGLIGGVSLSKIRDFSISVPPLAEQQIIVAKLDAAFAEINEIITSNMNKKNELAALSLSTSKLVFDKFRSEIQYQELGELCSKITDGVHKKPDYVEAGVPFLKINNLTAGEGISFKNISYITREAHEQFIKRTHPERDDILITKDGTIGVVRKIDTDIKFSIFVSLALIKPKEKKHSDYITHVLRSAYCQSQLNPSGAALKHIYLKDLRKLKIPISSDEVNLKIVKALNHYIEKISMLASIFEDKHSSLKMLKSAILAQELQSEAA
jgi:type I restriction enzyme S subunit